MDAGGFDCELTALVSAAVQIPVIASGGAGNAGTLWRCLGAGGRMLRWRLVSFTFGVTDSGS